MNDELRNLIMNASLDDDTENQAEFDLKESTKDAPKAEDQEPQEEILSESSDRTKADGISETEFIIPDNPIFSFEAEVQEEKGDQEAKDADLLNVEHFSDYKSKEEGFSGEFLFEAIDEEDTAAAEPVENITILSDEVEENEPVKEAIPQKRREDPDKAGYDPKKPRTIDKRFEFVELFVFTLLAVVLLTTFVFRHTKVQGGSMEDTLYQNDHLIITNFFYTPEAGDIIVLHDPATGHKDPLVKRIIATEGDTVEILPDGTVLVNDKPIPEDYVKDEPYKKSAMPKVTVPRDMVFVLGDNRNNSSDSRTFYPSMFVREDAILGKAVLRFYPDFEMIEHSKG